MELEISLLELCDEFIGILSILKDKSLISENDYITHLEQKNNFIEFYKKKEKLQ
ncbi:hypothetical protein [Tissierella sp.]|uniref:hypothetical protein n=1 Tax=Tissierella sp. TaxID=41274 RepID=UPI00285BFE0D|nr:hypothetical protein [Tissierella sp.]MDR7857798.1 hypothetical protein [Tissierella sp.]